MTLTRRKFGIGASGLVLGSIAAPFLQRAGAAGPAIRVGVVNSMSGSLAAPARCKNGAAIDPDASGCPNSKFQRVRSSEPPWCSSSWVNSQCSMSAHGRGNQP